MDGLVDPSSAPGLTYRLATSLEDREEIIRLREAVYVQEQHRLASVADMQATFDRFDAKAVYVIAEEGGVVTGTLKVVPDSDDGLPCDDVVDLRDWRGRGSLVEFGHLLTEPSRRQFGIGMGLMRAGLVHSVRTWRSTHIVGDFFVERGGQPGPSSLRDFYAGLGFVEVGDAYLDTRFSGAPPSVVAILDLSHAVVLRDKARASAAPDSTATVLEYFFHDLENLRSEALAEQSHRQDLAEGKAAHNHPTYSKMAFVMGCGVQRRGAGSHVEDEHGRRFLALFDQYGNQSFGYSNPRFVAALREQLDTGHLNSTKIMFEEVQVELAKRLSDLTGGRLRYCYLANGGGESIDNALKLARAGTGRPAFVSAVDCFHGKTFATLSASNRLEHRALYEPFMPGFTQVPFGDVDALDRVLDDSVAAVLLEPIQAEGGVILPPAGYLQEVRRLCTARGALLILDEMQTAFGRCGEFFAHQLLGVEPDLVCIGKAFGGGMLPISAVLGTPDVWSSLAAVPSTFGSSLGGNPLSCRLGLESVAVASNPAFLEGVRERAALIDLRLDEISRGFPRLIREHRGIGMMHGLEFFDPALGGLILGLLLARGVTSTYSLYNSRVLRIQPPLVVDMADLRVGLDALEDVIGEAWEFHQRTGVTGLNALPPLHLEVTVHCDSRATTKTLARYPRSLDPFSSEPRASAVPSPCPTTGTIGDGPVRWHDRLTTSEGQLRLQAEPGWLWERLDRTFNVVDEEGSATKVLIELDWDAGTGDYEPLLAGKVAHFAVERVQALARSFQMAEGDHR